MRTRAGADPERRQIGEKLINFVTEFLRNGFIQESRELSMLGAGPRRGGRLISCAREGDVLASERFRALKALTQVHGIGQSSRT